MFGLLFKLMLCSLVSFVKRQKQLGFPGPGEISSYNTVFLSLLVCERVCVVMMVGGVSQSQQTLYWQLSCPAQANLFGGRGGQKPSWLRGVTAVAAGDHLSGRDCKLDTSVALTVGACFI